ncbi:TPA: restriction endonuclease subunit S [Vibrio cholerae]|nr:restriction endonuclease subunit S [Vibrio cholerae]
MKIKAVSSQLFSESGLRLDCNPYMGGALEAKHTLKLLGDKCIHLSELTKGYKGGIYNGPVFKRNFVESAEAGVPFLTSATMLRADLREVPFLSAKDAKSSKLNYLELKPGMIMISCSGAIGNMVYVREEMDGFWSCQDQLKVCIDPQKVSSGYVYAFLNSKYGLPIITSGTYGAIIPHLEPVHIANLPVPFISKDIELHAHKLVEKASDFKTQFVRINKQLSERCEKLIGWDKHRPKDIGVKTNIVSSKMLKTSKRMDVLYFSKDEEIISHLLEKGSWKYLSDVCLINKPGMFKRIITSKEDGGIPFHTGSELFLMDAKPKYYVSKATSNIEQCILSPGWVLIQGFGQRGGLIGRVMLTTESLNGAAATDLQIQLKPNSKYEAGFIFSYLNSEPGYKSIIRLPVGGSIPNLTPRDISNVKIPWPDKDVRREIGELAIKAWELRDQALECEKQAIKMVEDAIEAAAPKH